MTQDTVKIRIATEQESDAILAVHMNAFGEGEGLVIVKLVDELLVDASGEPILSLVAETDAGLVGRLLFTSAKIEPEDSKVSATILAPLAVVQVRQRQGIGWRLIQAGLRQLGDSGQISSHNHCGWHIFCDHASGTNDAAISDRHATVNDRFASDPHIVADHDGLAEFLRATQFGFDRMRRRVNVNASVSVILTLKLNE